MLKTIKAELKLNSSITAKLFILNFRLASLVYTKGGLCKVFLINIILLKFLKFFCGLDISPKTRIGAGLVLFHPQNIVINSDSILGDNVMLKHNVTIGNKVNTETGQHVSPVIGNNVELSPGVVILGNVSIGDNAIIGAGAIVVKDIPVNSVAVGNPAKVIKEL